MKLLFFSFAVLYYLVICLEFTFPPLFFIIKMSETLHHFRVFTWVRILQHESQTQLIPLILTKHRFLPLLLQFSIF